jgi:hypothetical protein
MEAQDFKGNCSRMRSSTGISHASEI